MEDELGSDFAHADGFYLGKWNFPLNICAFEIIDCRVGYQKISLLLFLVVVELENGTAEINALWVETEIPPF